MNLSLPPFTVDHELPAGPAELTVMLVGLAARQGGSATAAAQASLDDPEPAAPATPQWLAPADGSFNGQLAAALARWRQE